MRFATLGRRSGGSRRRSQMRFAMFGHLSGETFRCPQIRFATFGRGCDFSSARAPPNHFSYISLPLLFISPYTHSLFPWSGVIHFARCYVSSARAPPSISHIIDFSSNSFYFPLYASTLPSARGYTLARCCFHPRGRPLHSHISLPLLFISPYMLPLFLRLGVIYTLARCYFFICATARSISHRFFYHFFLFPPICFHSSFG